MGLFFGVAGPDAKSHEARRVASRSLWRATWAVARKELRHITRNPLTLFLVSLSPALLLFMLANVFSFEVNHATLAILDLAQSRLSRDYVTGIVSNDVLTLAGTVADYQAAEHLLVAGTVDGVLVIPPDFDQGFYGRQQAQVQLLVDGSNPIIAGQVINMVSAASASVGRKLAGQMNSPGLPFEVRTRIWYNATLSSLVSMVPGLMAIVLTLPALALALSLTRERELGTLEALMATPIPKAAYLFGKTAAYLLTGLVGFLGTWLVAVAWFRVPMRGDMGLLVLLTVAYFLATMGFSLFVSSWVSSQQTAMFLVITVFYVPSFFLTGLIDPIDWSSWRAVALALPLPATHYMTIARGIFLKGVGLEILGQPAAILLGMGLAGLVVGTAVFRKKLA